MTYHIMHDNKIVAQIDTQGYCHIFSKKFMPYNLYLDETDNGPLNNLSNFYFWCTSRILPANRQHKDVILKSLNLTSKKVCSNSTPVPLFISNRCLLGSHL